jgi:hypothetical protein
MSDLKRHCPTCNLWLQLSEQTRDRPVRCPHCKNVVAPPPVLDVMAAEEDEPPVLAAAPTDEDEPTPRRRSRREEDEEDDRPRRRRDEPRYRDEIPEDVKERASRLSLRFRDLEPETGRLIDQELHEDEKVVWFGRPDRGVKFLRNLGWVIGGGVGLALAVLCFLLAFITPIGGGFFLVGLFLGFACGFILFAQMLRLLIPDGRVYVLTTRRALSIGWMLFSGTRATTYGPEVAACPRVRRAWFVANAGDLVMRTLVVTTTYHSRRGMPLPTMTRSRRFFGFIDIRNLDEVDQLCADVLGVYVEEMRRPKAYWDAMDVLQYGTWIGAPGLLFTCCLCVGFGGLLGDRDGKGGAEATMREQPWQVQNDPGAKLPDNVQPVGAAIKVGVHGPIFPYHPAPFVAVETGLTSKRRTPMQVYDLAKWQKLGPEVIAEYDVGSKPALSPDGRWLAMAHPTKRGTVYCCGPAAAVPVEFDAKLEPGWEITRVEFAAPGKAVVLTGNHDNGDRRGRRFLVYDVEQRREVCLGKLPGQAELEPISVGFSAGGRYLALAVGPQGMLAFWDLQTGNEAGALELGTQEQVWGVSFAPSGDRVAVLLRTDQTPARVKVWKLADRSLLHDHRLPDARVNVEGPEIRKGGKASLQWLPDETGWLVFGYLVTDRQGQIVAELKRDTRFVPGPVVERVFRSNDQVTDVGGLVGRDLTVIDVPRR